VAEVGGQADRRVRNGRAEVARQIEIVLVAVADGERRLARRIIDGRLGGYRPEGVGNRGVGFDEVGVDVAAAARIVIIEDADIDGGAAISVAPAADQIDLGVGAGGDIVVDRGAQTVR